MPSPASARLMFNRRVFRAADHIAPGHAKTNRQNEGGRVADVSAVDLRGIRLHSGRRKWPDQFQAAKNQRGSKDEQ